MSRNRFVSPEVVRLELSDGDWIEVKKRLGIAAQKRIESAMIRGVQGSDIQRGANPRDVELRLDTTAAYIAKLKAYLLDWSFKGADDKPVRVSDSAIENLDPDTADEIITVLNKFLDEEVERRKDNPFTKENSTQQSA